MPTQNKIQENVEQNEKATKMLGFFTKVDYSSEMAGVIKPAISAACVAPEYVMPNVASFPHLTDESFFSKLFSFFSFLMNLCFIPHLGLTPYFHLLVMPPEHFVGWNFIPDALIVWLSVDSVINEYGS